MNAPIPAPTRARQQAGFSVAVAAKRARITPEFLALLEKRGGFSYALASRLAALYGCGLDVFLNLTNNPAQACLRPKTKEPKTLISDTRNVFATSRNVAGHHGGMP